MAPAPPVDTMPVKPKPFGRTRRVGKAFLRIYLLVGILFYFLQAKLIFPGAATQGTQDAQVTAPPYTELLHLTAQDASKIPIVALFGKAMLKNGVPDPEAASRPTVIYFYGNGMCLADSVGEFDLFRGLGCNCIAVEYEGYGLSGGKPSEKGCYAAAEAAYQHLLTRKDIDPKKLIAAGWSLGGAVAIDLAHRHREEAGGGGFVGLITFCTFTSMAELGQHHYPMFPISLLLEHRFLSEEKIRDLHIPYFLAHGKRDSIVPFAHSDRLAAQYGSNGPLTRFISPAADHNDFFDVSANELGPALDGFLKTLAAR